MRRPRCTWICARRRTSCHVLDRNTAKDHVETFALSRFRRIGTTGHTFARLAEFNPEAYTRQSFGITGREIEAGTRREKRKGLIDKVAAQVSLQN